jgi:hypothetical protein
MLLFDMLLSFSELRNRPHKSMPFSVLCICIGALQHWPRAMYSAYVELNAISVWSLLNEYIGTPANTMINHVHDKHESRKCVNFWCHTPAKLLSHYAYSERFLFGFMMSGLSFVHCK